MEDFEAGGENSKESSVVEGHLDYEEIASETSAMGVKQELQDAIEEYKIDIEEHFHPNEDVWNNHESIIVKNEWASIKHEEKVDLVTDHSGQRFIESNRRIDQVDVVSKKCRFVKIEDSVQSKKAMEVKQELHDPIEEYGIDVEENAFLNENLCNNHTSDVVKNEWVPIKREEEVDLGIDHSERAFIGDLVLVDDASQNCDYIKIEDFQQLEEVSNTQQLSQWSQSIFFETGQNQDQFNTKHTINVKVNDKKKERQQKYREQNREKLKQREAERRERIRNLLRIARPSTPSNKHRTESNNKEIITANSKSSSGCEGPQTSMQRNEQAEERNALGRRRQRQQRYRERNREKLKQREAERRERIRNLLRIARPSTSSNIHRIELNNKEIITANSKSSSGFEGPQPSIRRNEQAEEKNSLERKRERQQRYRERNREKLKQYNRERRERLRYKQIIATINRMELNNEEMITALSQSLSGLEETQTYDQINEQAKENDALQRKRERQQRYRERNREKLIERNRERRRYIQIIEEPNISRIELNNEEIVTAISQSSSGLEGPQTSIQPNGQAKENDALQSKRERQQRYRERNRDKLKQREAERRRRLQNAQYRFYGNNK